MNDRCPDVISLLVSDVPPVQMIIFPSSFPSSRRSLLRRRRDCRSANTWQRNSKRKSSRSKALNGLKQHFCIWFHLYFCMYRHHNRCDLTLLHLNLLMVIQTLARISWHDQFINVCFCIMMFKSLLAEILLCIMGTLTITHMLIFHNLWTDVLWTCPIK